MVSCHSWRNGGVCLKSRRSRVIGIHLLLSHKLHTYAVVIPASPPYSCRRSYLRAFRFQILSILFVEIVETLFALLVSTAAFVIVMACWISPVQRVIADIGVEIERLRVTQLRIRNWLGFRRPVRRHEPAHAAGVEPRPEVVVA